MNRANLHFTDSQRKSVTHVAGPLLISAGAGSGKTFTLQQRIVYALSDESGPFLGSVDELLAITFTEKAADEIKSRVRSALRNEGLFHHALAIDNAWISTIHGFAQRVLKEHALELGIDPGFTIVDAVMEAELKERAVSQVLEVVDLAVLEGGERGRSLRTLFDEYGADAVLGMIDTIRNEAMSLPSGFAALRWGIAPVRSPRELARELLAAYEAVLGAEPPEAGRACCTTAMESLETFLLEPTDVPSLIEERFAELLPQLKTPSLQAKAAKQAIVQLRVTLAQVGLEFNLARSLPLTTLLVELAEQVQQVYEDMLTTHGAFDFSLLLRRTYEALRDYPDIAQSYRKQFRMVMVDEFQDTDQLQIEIIQLITGPQRSTLCTVGDSQQSIYGFRGANVNVYTEHKRQMREETSGILDVSLDENFRSHGDILAFVRKICGVPGYFSEPFLDLKPARDEEKLRAAGRQYQGFLPRVQVHLTTYERNTIRAPEAALYNAQLIAGWFAALHARGHRFGDMALLMGKLSDRVELYSQALREAELPFVITGGSGFWGRPEVTLIGQLLLVLAQPSDTQALFAVLTGPLFCLSDDDLIRLATREANEREKPAGLRACALDSKFYPWLEQDASEALRFAHEVLSRAWDGLGKVEPSCLVRQVVNESGWFDRLGALGQEGQAVAANVVKALRIIETIQAEAGFDMARVSQRFAALSKSGAQEKLGTLVGQAGEAIRIMTIHSSKGLEFPLVAVAECFSEHAKKSALQVLNDRGQAFLSLMPKRSLVATAGDEKAFAAQASCVNDLGSAENLALYQKSLERRLTREETLERRRLLYVALTRASEALFIGAYGNAKADKIFDGLKGDIQFALFGEEPVPVGTTQVDFGGSAPAEVTHLHISAKDMASKTPMVDDVSLEDISEQGSASNQEVEAGLRVITFPLVETPPKTRPLMVDKLDTGLFSYSSLASHDEAFPEAPTHSGFPFTSDYDKATDFGSAFHRLAQYAALTDAASARKNLPRLAARYGLHDGRRLEVALERWLSSELCERVFAYTSHEPEVPFTTEVIGAGVLEGEIDLLCTQEGSSEALIIDYKTGGSSEESTERLQEKHRLQAQCYAFATLRHGYRSVELCFVRVEQPARNDPSQPQVVNYRFTTDDLAALESTIRQAYAVAAARC